MGQLQVFQHLHHRVPEREEKKQENANQFEKLMKENFPNLVKVKDMQVQETQRDPNRMDDPVWIPKEACSETHHN